MKQDIIVPGMGVQFGWWNSKIDVKSGEVKLEVQSTGWAFYKAW
jgi:hypothetical protein